MIVRHKILADFPAFYTDSGTGELVGMSDHDLQFNRPLNAELDRLSLEMYAEDRARGKELENWQLDAEAAALARMPDAAVINLCRSIRAAGGRLPEPYQERFREALLRRSLVGDEVAN